MLTNHYQDKPDKYFHHARHEMVSFVPETVSTILEIGCGNGAFAAELKQQRPVHITGVEPYADAAHIAANRIDQIINANIESAMTSLENKVFDCIVCNDVLEHLIDPWNTVLRLRDLLNPGGYFVASIPNVRHFEVMKDLLINSNWQYLDQGVLDRTHLRFFTASSIQALFAEAGLRVIKLQGINGGPFPWKFALLNRLLFNSLDDMRWIQFACVSQRPPE